MENQNKFDIGAFILNESFQNKEPFKKNPNLFLTQKGNEGIKQEILKLIHGSTKSLKICSFIINDGEIFEALLTKAQEYRTAIFILTQLDERKIINTSSENWEDDDTDITPDSIKTHLSYIKKLYDVGIHVGAAATTHAKFIIADSRTAFLTSANLTPPSLNENTESGIYLEEADIPQLEQLFDVIYQRGTAYRHYLDAGSKTIVVQSIVNMSLKLLPDSTHSRLRFTYEKLSNSLYEEMVSLVNRAQTFLYISTFSIVGVDKLHELKDAIINAVTRGVKVEVFSRGMNYREDHLEGCRWFAEAGSSLHGDFLNHSKGIVSELDGLIFTANIDGNHGLINGFEVGYLLTEQQRNLFLQFHRYLISDNVYKFKLSPLKMELFKTYKEYEERKQIFLGDFPDDVVISGDSSVLEKKQDFIDYPVFFAEKNLSNFLIANGQMYPCTYIDGNFTLSAPQKVEQNLHRCIVKYKNLTLNLTDGN